MKRAATAVYVLTQQGAMTARLITSVMAADVFMPPSLASAMDKKERAIPFDSLRALIAETFSAYRRHIFITAAGVAVRCIAPYLRDKRIDPAIIVLDQHGKNVISLLSGHLDGTNTLAREVAKAVNGQAVITTVTNEGNTPSFDVLALEFNLTVANIRAISKINNALSCGVRIVVDDPKNFLQLRDSAWHDLFIFTATNAYAALSAEEAEIMPRVTVTPDLVAYTDHHLVLHPKVLHVGVDCHHRAKASKIVEHINTSLTQLELSPGSVACIACRDTRQHERGLIETAERLYTQLRFFGADELTKVSLETTAKKIQDPFDNDNICEAAALLAAGKNAVLRIPKISTRGVSIAIAEERAFSEQNSPPSAL